MLKSRIYIIPFLFLLNAIAFGNLICPANGVELNYIHVIFEWEQEPDAMVYNLQASTSLSFNNLLLDVNEATTVYINKDNFSSCIIWIIIGTQAINISRFINMINYEIKITFFTCIPNFITIFINNSRR